MPDSFHIADEYRRLLGEFANGATPGRIPTRETGNEAGYDPLRPLPLGQISPIISRLCGTRSDVPMEWRLGAYLGANTVDLVTARALGSTNIGDALIVAHQHQHIHSNVRSFTLRPAANGNLTEFHHAAGSDPYSRFVFHSLLAAKVWLLLHFYKGMGIHHQVDGRAKCFGTLLRRFSHEFDFLDVEFRDSEVVLDFSRDLLVHNLPDMGDRQRRACDQELRRRGVEFHSITLWADRIRNHIRSSNFAEVSFSEISEIFRVQKRTLGRMLRDEGTNFTSILTELRRERAIHLVRSTGMPLKRIAAELGFNSDASFNMAFKSWTGETPMRFRKNGACGTPANDAVPPAVSASLAAEYRFGGIRPFGPLGPRWSRASGNAGISALER